MPDTAVPSVTTTDPLTPHVGAVLHGLILSPDMPDAAVDAVRAALAEHLVVILPDQDLSAADLKGVRPSVMSCPSVESASSGRMRAQSAS